MKIILLEEVEDLGLPGDVVEVARGYAQNFLIPTKQAAIATPGLLHDLQKKLDARRKKVEIERATAVELAEMLEATTLKLTAKAGEAGKLYGSITVSDLVDAIKETTGIDTDRKKIVLAEPIKTLGEYKVNVKVHVGIEAVMKLHVYDEQTGIPVEEKEVLAEMGTAAAAPLAEEVPAEEEQLVEDTAADEPLDEEEPQEQE